MALSCAGLILHLGSGVVRLLRLNYLFEICFKRRAMRAPSGLSLYFPTFLFSFLFFFFQKSCHKLVLQDWYHFPGSLFGPLELSGPRNLRHLVNSCYPLQSTLFTPLVRPFQTIVPPFSPDESPRFSTSRKWWPEAGPRPRDLLLMLDSDPGYANENRADQGATSVMRIYTGLKRGKFEIKSNY
jgi:hypothetical protein